ncbi:MAG: sodium:proton exchanger [Actinomycetota bacterium]|nr:sodium:proton exchanger [Actinomycetota bacterium]
MAGEPGRAQHGGGLGHGRSDGAVAPGGTGRSAIGWRRGDTVALAAAVAASLAATGAAASGMGAVGGFIVQATALACLAALVSRTVEQLGLRWSPAATGIVQATVGNLPELLFGIFALRAGLTSVVQAALVGSVLANVLLVLGLSFTVGGLRHGTQRFVAADARTSAVLLLVAASVVAVPSVTALAHTPAAAHEHALSDVASVVLLVAYAAALVASLRSSGGSGPRLVPEGAWPVSLALGVLVAGAGAATLVSEWLVSDLRPAIHLLGMSSTFAGVVVVAIAGNAVEHVGGVVLAAKDRTDHALAVILQSPIQVLLGVFPLLVLLGPVLGGGLTLALPTLLLIGLAVGSVVTVAVVVDGESTWLEGLCLMGLYIVVAAAAWWHVG